MQCQSPVQLRDPFKMHPGYVTYLGNRMKKAMRAHMDWQKCQREATHGCMCRQHAALAALDANA